MQTPPTSRIVASKNRNRNMVLAMLAKSPCRYDQQWYDCMTPFGVALLIGLNRRVHLVARDWPYERLPGCAANYN